MRTDRVCRSLPSLRDILQHVRRIHRLIEVRVRKFGWDNYVSDQWSIQITKQNTIQRCNEAVGECTGRSRRPHPKIQHLHQMIQGIET